MMLSAIDSRARSQVMLALFQFTIDLPQIIERSVRPNARRGGRAVEDLRHIVVLEIVIACEDEHCALLRLESHHRLLEQRVPLAHRLCMRWSIGLFWNTLHRFVSSSLSPEFVTDVVCHAKQPGRERGVAAKSVAIFQNSKKRLLSEIVGGVSATREAIAERMHPCVMPLEEHAESVDVPLAHVAHQCFVGCVVHAREPSRFSSSLL